MFGSREKKGESKDVYDPSTSTSCTGLPVVRYVFLPSSGDYEDTFF